MMLLIRAWPFILAAVLTAVAGWQGYRMGYNKCEAAHNLERLAQIEAGQKLEAARRQALSERDELARRLDEEGFGDTVYVERCLGPSRVQRLNGVR